MTNDAIPSEGGTQKECFACGCTDFQYTVVSGKVGEKIDLSICEGCGNVTGELGKTGLLEAFK